MRKNTLKTMIASEWLEANGPVELELSSNNASVAQAQDRDVDMDGEVDDVIVLGVLVKTEDETVKLFDEFVAENDKEERILMRIRSGLKTNVKMWATDGMTQIDILPR